MTENSPYTLTEKVVSKEIIGIKSNSLEPVRRIGYMGRYDITSKVLFKDYERDFVALALKDRNFEIVGTIPTEFPSVQMRMTDAPVKVRIGDEEAIVP